MATLSLSPLPLLSSTHTRPRPLSPFPIPLPATTTLSHNCTAPTPPVSHCLCHHRLPLPSTPSLPHSLAFIPPGQSPPSSRPPTATPVASTAPAFFRRSSPSPLPTTLRCHLTVTGTPPQPISNHSSFSLTQGNPTPLGFPWL
ncbi:hypothetical protein Droror1_Dr00005798 [Drosera rotundifolia]